jgi:hypothetical protein
MSKNDLRFTGDLRYRQIHLDFHTSPAIPGIGAAFDAEEFAATLEKAHVNSVTSFVRCHHGHIYYQSKKHPERIHPNLVSPNLIIDQIEACHKRNIRVPLYTTVQWDEFSADSNRDWLCIDIEGREYGTKPLEAGFYRILDVFHPGYRQFLFDHVKEVCETMPVDGFFFDIVAPRISYAKHWLDGVEKAGLNPEKPSDIQQFAAQMMRDWQNELTAFVQQFHPDATIFYNSGHIGPHHREEVDAFTHFELESLPSGGWGYLHFPQAMRLARTLGPDCMGMTGKFHTSWGDFHSYKNPAALQFECFQMLALNAKCSVGDQLPPNGKIDAATYDLIGGVYAEVEKKEPWCVGAKAVCDVALLTTESFASAQFEQRHPTIVMGAIRMLHELRVQFDIVDTKADLSQYKLLILPDEIPVATGLGMKLDAFLAQGGAIIASYHSGLDPETGGFFSDIFGVEEIGEAPYSPDFIVPTDRIGSKLPRTGHVMYKKGFEVRATASGDILASTEVPYFNRTWKHFCSHAHTPSSGNLSYPAIVQNRNCIYFAHPVFGQYNANAPLWVKTLVGDAIKLLLPDPVLEVGGPSSIIAALNEQSEQSEQKAEKRYILHLLHYIPERRGGAFDVIEDIIPVYDIPVRVKMPNAQFVQSVPDGEILPFMQEGEYVTFTVPEINGHTMIEIC